MLIPSFLRRINSLAPSYSTPRRGLKNRAAGVDILHSGQALASSVHPGAFSS